MFIKYPKTPEPILILTQIGGLVLTLLLLFAVVLDSTAPFDTDEADHANAALEMLSFSQTNTEPLTKQSFYPPFHSILVSISYSLFEPSLASSRLPSLLILILIALVLPFYAAVPLVLSPVFIESASLCMLELPAVLLVALIFKLLKYPRTNNIDYILGLLLSLVFLTKYSFGIIALPAFLFVQKPIRALLTAALVLSIWFLNSDINSFWRFLVGHPSYVSMWSLENLLFYPKALIFNYPRILLFGLATIYFALVGLLKFSKTPDTRFAAAIFIVSSILLTISTTNETRHFILGALALYYLAAEALSKSPLHFRLAFLGLSLASNIFVISSVPKIAKDAFEAPQSFKTFHDFAAYNLNGPTVACGLFDRLGREAFVWTLASSKKLPPSQIAFDEYPFTNLSRLKERKRNIPLAIKNGASADISFSQVISSGLYEQALVVVDKRKEPSACLKELSQFPFIETTHKNRTVRIFNLVREHRPELPK